MVYRCKFETVFIDLKAGLLGSHSFDSHIMHAVVLLIKVRNYSLTVLYESQKYSILIKQMLQTVATYSHLFSIYFFM